MENDTTIDTNELSHLRGIPTLKQVISIALDAGVLYNDDMTKIIEPIMRALNPNTYKLEAILEWNNDGDAYAHQLLVNKPRGHYVLFRTATEPVRWQGWMSDGSQIATGGSSNIKDERIAPEKLRDWMVGYEVYLLRREVEAERERQANLAAAVYFQANQTLRNITLKSDKFSTLIVNEVNENGMITATGIKRGSAKSYDIVIGASHLKNLYNLT